MWKNWLPLKDRIDEMLPAHWKSQGIWFGMESGHPGIWNMWNILLFIPVTVNQGENIFTVTWQQLYI